MTRCWTALALCAPALLAGCKDESKKSSQSAPIADRVVQAVELDMRTVSGMPRAPRFRGVQLYRQAKPQVQAVCGQVSPFGDDGNIFVPFVSVVTASGDEPPRYAFEHRIGSSTAEASRVYAAIVAFCWDGGGPAPGPSPGAAPTPPLPDTVSDPAAPPSPPAKPGPAAGAPASGSVTVRQAATLHPDPHGGAGRTVQRGTSLKVFSQAPGGWLQVGTSAPEGWMHESMLDRH